MASGKSLTLDTSVQYVKGIGPKRAELLKRAGIEVVEDLLTTFPRRYLDRSHVTSIRSLKSGDEVTVVGRVYSCETRRGRSQRFIVIVGDGSGFLHCVWFRGLQYIAKAFQEGDTVAFSGKVTLYRGLQLVHPEYDKLSEEGESDPLHSGGIIPLYPSTEYLSRIGLDGRGFRRIIREALNALDGAIPETLSDVLIQEQKLVSRMRALEDVHFAKEQEALRRARHRLKFEELFFIQLFLAMERHNRKAESKGIAFQNKEKLTRKFAETLPFELTSAQKKVITEIRNDMISPRLMNRLLQGDVGSGKTVVAMFAMLLAVENGYQVALMAPTEILAEQHFLTVHKWLEDLDVKVTLLKGSQKTAERKDKLQALVDGSVDIVIGTHALVQEKVAFQKLGLVIIDEQHRFGVMQRAVLRQKGAHPDTLIMTATPIPRTLALTLYGDLDVSILNELPTGRQPVQTVWRKEASRSSIYEFLKDEVKMGRQAYVVYPLVEESEKMDLADATAGYEKLSSDIFPNSKVALLHGRMKTEEKESTMQAFKSGEVQILVSTTVIEVGVDVPNATIMLIEHAERFGLTQLHQLRGRVGRGTQQSICILMSGPRVTDDAYKRIQTMTETSDGFRISEADLEIRGPGELFGTRQHGLLNLKIANLMTDQKILETARDEAFQLVSDDPKLMKEVNRPVHDTYQSRYQEKFGLIQVG